ncbi:hypothetical protein Hanom_Chr09g00825411 [Helianthus anomalus]
MAYPQKLVAVWHSVTLPLHVPENTTNVLIIILMYYIYITEMILRGCMHYLLQSSNVVSAVTTHQCYPAR